MAKSSNKKAQPTVDEIIATLKKTSLPTVICEGSDDLIVYRRLENRLSDLGVSVLPAGGRKNVLSIFSRRGEFPTSLKIAFIADQDVWVNSGIPVEYVSPILIFTDGYSIENDIFLDGNLLDLLVGTEVGKFQTELGLFIDWYALALTRHLASASNPITLHPDHVLDNTQRPGLVALQPGEAYPTDLKNVLVREYGRLLRGKSLLSLLIRNTNTRVGQPKHTDTALIEMVAARPGPRLQRTAEAVAVAIS
ncbi:hypothetical protein [Burkholderia ubonensis]|uniref:hypothetical protein n=1 Tax=Burkholderia ubonensis TaxID=101571 RepID=UPI000AE9452B|nr:hypothetical protein [Burkholderia ubonensis]